MTISYPTGEFSASQNSKSICPKHLAEWVEGSAVSEAIALLNIDSLTAKELTERIRPKNPIKTGGWCCYSVNWRTGVKLGLCQAKPDKPHHPEGQKKAAKYLTPSGMEPDPIFLAMSERDYWFKTRNDTSIPRHWTEGVKKAAAGLSIGLATIAFTGVWNWGKDKQLAKDVEHFAQPNTIHYIDFDSDYADNPSCRAAILEFGRLLEKHGCEVYVTVWDTKFKGMDDFIKANGAEAFKEAVANAPSIKEWERQLKKSDRKNAASTSDNSYSSRTRTHENVVRLSSFSSAEDYIPDTAPLAEKNFVLKAEEALYSNGHWASITGQLYEFTGTHYELRPEVVEKRRIRDYLSNYSEMVKGVPRKKYANSASINQVYDWVVAGFAVDPNTINPDGLNSSKGVIKINPDGSHSLVPHDPKQVYTYVGCGYEPDVDRTDNNRLLECLEPSQREIFLRTAAAALNLKLVRSKLTGRGVKGLLCFGEGSNGKDTLRAVLAAVFGRGMTNKSLSDFKSYDTGRKFNLSGLVGGICNWASENTAKVDLDNIQSLKQFITGDPIDIEPKGKDSYEYKPVATFFANCNKLPSITGGTAAIDDRYGILTFKKTYKRNADPSQGELEADPRFKDDETFILERIAPAMLNEILERLPLLLKEGIDYAATREAMREAQEESRHLWQFAREVGLEAQSGGRVWVKDLWQQLQDWYEDSGILEKEYANNKEKLVWNELSNKYDAPVKAINQLSSRLSEIFPKLQVCKYFERDEIERRGQRYLLGIGFVQSSETSAKTSVPSVPTDTALDVEVGTVRDTASLTSLPSAVPSAVPKNSGTDVGTDDKTAQTLVLGFVQQIGTDGTAISLTAAEILKIIHQLPDSEREKLAEALTGQDLYRPFKVGDRVAHVNPAEKSYNWHGRIVQITSSRSCMVDWDERENIRGGRVISALFCNLRHI